LPLGDTDAVKRITPEQLPAILAQLPPRPRIIASGNFAAPHTLLGIASEQSVRSGEVP